MNIEDTLRALKIDRAIWIDDEFITGPEKLAQLLISELETSTKCNFDVISTYFDQYESDPAEFGFQITQYITDLNEEERETIKQKFFAEEAKLKGFPTEELAYNQFQYAIDLLGINKEDLWTFDDVDAKLETIEDANRKSIIFLVDLNHANGSTTEGLEALKKIDKKGCSFTFIVTHETAVNGESQKEIELRTILSKDQIDLPVCVIAKERLRVSAKEELTEPLKVALKRAGLHTSMHTVLNSLKLPLQHAFEDAKARILEVPPEQLEKYVIDKAMKEGVSELHVIERALSAQLSSRIRQEFAVEQRIIACNEKLRGLEKIKLVQEGENNQLHENINLFRKLEVWEDDSLINKSFAPIACGDVFDVQGNGSKKKFVLLAQPCDISLRGDSGQRSDSLGYFVELKLEDISDNPDLRASCSPSNDKKVILPFTIDSKKYICDFRNATPVNLNILDLASLNPEGIVHFTDALHKPEYLMKGLQVAMDHRFREFGGYLTDLNQPTPISASVTPEPFGIYLAFSQKSCHKSIMKGVFKKTEKKSGATLPNRLEWALKRSGRIRNPFSSYILASYLNAVGRSAFEIDYTN